MTKSKRARTQQHSHAAPTGHGAGMKRRKMSSFAKLSTKNNYNSNNIGSGTRDKDASAKANASNKNVKKNQLKQKQQRRPIVPFRRGDRILLVGEGDFSFAHSLATHHQCQYLVATCYDSEETLCSKYPQAEKNIAGILHSSKTRSRTRAVFKTGEASNTAKVLYSVDAKKLGLPSGGGKEIRNGFPKEERKVPAWEKKGKTRSTGDGKDKGGPWDMICFNFPHVGGLSTDVNRQVRANQELLVSFFKACVPLLAGRPEAVDEGEDEDDEWESDTENGSDDNENMGASRSDGDNDNDHGNGTVRAKNEHRTEPGQVLVTLFEGEPYTLWNIRDLARHAGLRVVTSFIFPWACYQGYSHARTLGEVEGKNGGRGGWRGEDREARMYVFEVKTDEHTTGITEKRKKALAETDDSDSN
ncbi:hypothetical protein BJY04DRAFT_33349 [Aspergillus karnatakaensis]|uniref:25S rRNA (uracil2634-N3)-methyltransferase n=1 Tax=Aspergillus karnatakaensis TaxID=1810916 RepID=UPI003CCCDABC